MNLLVFAHHKAEHVSQVYCVLWISLLDLTCIALLFGFHVFLTNFTKIIGN